MKFNAYDSIQVQEFDFENLCCYRETFKHGCLLAWQIAISKVLFHFVKFISLTNYPG